MLKGLLNLFLKSDCPLCQRPANLELCDFCQRQLQKCQLPNCKELWQGELPVFGWGAYGGILKRAIAALKYENQPQLARPLGQYLGKAWLNAQVSFPGKVLQPPTVVPIPLHAAKLKKRGFNQAELLAESFCQVVGLQLRAKGLERVKETEALFGLAPQERLQNLQNAFQVGKGLRRQSQVLLLDDIYTTGNTVAEAAKALQEQGIATCGVVAIAIPFYSPPEKK